MGAHERVDFTMTAEAVEWRPTYDVQRSYDDNYAAGPTFAGPLPPVRSGEPCATFLGYPVYTPLGIPAGPLLNSDWIALYARLGFDLLTYKTVRSVARPAHPFPNCLYLDNRAPLDESDIGGPVLALADQQHSPEQVTITNSFGMPSRAPAVWQADLERALGTIGRGQVVIASVVGTSGVGDLAGDFGRAVALAAEVRPHAIEINLSCPNVQGGEGSLFQTPEAAERVVRRAWEAVGTIPLVIKIGYVTDEAVLAEVMRRCGPFIQGVAGINTIPMAVRDAAGRPALGDAERLRAGVCGGAIRALALRQVQRLVDLRHRLGMAWTIIGVGGIFTAEDVDAHLGAGADAAMSATGAMWNPLLAQQWWERSGQRSRISGQQKQ
jgi:dihydroorotate dehydrogenase (NAD+) catalytic subunit